MRTGWSNSPRGFERCRPEVNMSDHQGVWICISLHIALHVHLLTCLYDKAWSKAQWIFPMHLHLAPNSVTTDLVPVYFLSQISYHQVRIVSFQCIVSCPNQPPTLLQFRRRREAPPDSSHSFQRPDLTSNPLETMICLHCMNSQESPGDRIRY